MSSVRSFMNWTIPLTILVFTVQITPSFAQCNNNRQGCPVGGYATIACPITDDNVIRESVISRLSGTVSPRATMIIVGVKNGIVTLTGVVDTVQTKQLATTLASQIHGTQCVRNYLSISPIGNWDLTVVRDVRNALSKYPIAFHQVMVDAREGIVELRGMVANEDDREQAVMIAASVPGVTAVHNGLAVSWSSGSW